MQLGKVRLANGQLAVVRPTNDMQSAQVLEISKVPGIGCLGDLLAQPDPAAIADEIAIREAISLAGATWLPPVDRQEIWASGVTYKRSKVAREEESQGAAKFYDLVYTAERPELFFKATPERAIGHLGKVRLRKDSKWNVPEPELTLVIRPDLSIVGYTIGNDMSSRDIEGENPLYLPQAKFYSGACAVGPTIKLLGTMQPLATVGIRLTIKRAGAIAFDGQTSVSELTRTPEELVKWLGKETDFPHGALLMTGTGIVPPDSFTLASGDEIAISIDGIGTLINTVA